MPLMRWRGEARCPPGRRALTTELVVSEPHAIRSLLAVYGLRAMRLLINLKNRLEGI